MIRYLVLLLLVLGLSSISLRTADAEGPECEEGSTLPECEEAPGPPRPAPETPRPPAPVFQPDACMMAALAGWIPNCDAYQPHYVGSVGFPTQVIVPWLGADENIVVASTDPGMMAYTSMGDREFCLYLRSEGISCGFGGW